MPMKSDVGSRVWLASGSGIVVGGVIKSNESFVNGYMTFD